MPGLLGQVHMTGGAGLMDMNGLSGSIADIDVEDLRKEEEEAGFLFIAEEIERCVGLTNLQSRVLRMTVACIL